MTEVERLREQLAKATAAYEQQANIAKGLAEQLDRKNARINQLLGLLSQKGIAIPPSPK